MVLQKGAPASSILLTMAAPKGLLSSYHIAQSYGIILLQQPRVAPESVSVESGVMNSQNAIPMMEQL